MIHLSSSSRQPRREAWTMDRLINERSISLGYSLDSSSYGTYTSALNSYLTFCNLHNLPVDPTPDNLSFYVVFISSHIDPKSVNSYLSGICRQLEPFFPEVRRNRNSVLVSRTMTGCMRRFGNPVKRKTPLSHANLLFILDSMVSQPSHDDLLFAALLLTGFHALMRLGELVFPDKKILRNYRKISLRHSVSILPDQYSFFLPSHKADRFFEGNSVIIQKIDRPTDPYQPFLNYIKSRDRSFPIHPELWLTSCGSVPLVSGLSRVFVPSFLPILPVSLFDRAEQLLLLKVEPILRLYRPLAGGTLTPFGFISVRIRFFSMPFSSAVLPISVSIRLISSLFLSLAFFPSPCSFFSNFSSLFTLS